MLRTILAFSFFVSVLFAETKDLALREPISVELQTNTQLRPIYLAPFFDKDSGFDSFYLGEIERVLRFDLRHNGRLQLLPDSETRKAQAVEEGFGGYYDREAWKRLGARYVMKVKVEDKKLSVSVFSVPDYNVKTVSDVYLSGSLFEDRRLLHQVEGALHKAFFASEGVADTRIIYTLKTREDENDSSQWSSQVWECDYDGALAKQLSQDERFCVTPSYLPPHVGYNPTHYFYVSYRMGQPKIFVASLQEGIGRRFSYLRGNQLMPVVSRQRDQVAFICDVAGNPDIFVQAYNTRMGAIGKPRQVFTARRGTQASPCFSPDGKRLAFVSDKDGSPRIYVMNIPRPGARLEEVRAVLISKKNRENTAPAWSPDGQKLAYSSMTEGVRQIWVYDFETQEETQLTHGGNLHRENPSWAPNSLHLVFNAANDRSSELFIINLNQPEPLKISSGSGEKRFAVWQPRTEDE